jgi:quercetin dioxygenase-like cupin family protein
MDLFRYSSAEAQPLPGGANAFYTAVRRNNRTIAMMLVIDKRGDTGKRAIRSDTVITVIAGEGNIRAGGSVAELRPGDVVTMPGGREHQIWTSTSGLHLVIVNVR